MERQEVTANLMTLGGLVIAIGLVVDAAIIVTENIARHMSEKAESDHTRHQVAYEAIREVAKPVIFAIFIIIIVFIPLFTLESLEGKMFKPLALTICFALISSLVVSLTIVPVLASMITKRVSKDAHENLLIRVFHAIHMPALALAIKGRWITVAIAAPWSSRRGNGPMPNMSSGSRAMLTRPATAIMIAGVLVSPVARIALLPTMGMTRNPIPPYSHSM